MAQITKEAEKTYHEQEEEETQQKEIPDDPEYAYEDRRSKREYRQTRIKDKEDRATVEQCLDPRTRVILMKMINNKFLKEINGCISTGKEANVYHGWDFNNLEYAIKVYKTSILVFKDRDKYVSGEFRFRNGHCKSNPRKMVRLWAEKELRNYKRIFQSSIPCPEPISVKSNIIVMRFIGEDMTPAPRLKDATDVLYEDAYMQVVKCMRILYQECKLIHGDLSEYNLLYYKNKVYFIDVSQSMESDHHSASEFLKRDIYNINQYFKKKDIMTFTLRQLYKFITNPHLQNINEELERMQEEREQINEDLEEEQDKVFVGAIQPKNLNDLPQKIIESELNAFKKGGESIGKTIADFQNANLELQQLNNGNELDDNEDSNEDDDESNKDDQDCNSDSSSDVSLLSDNDDDQEQDPENQNEDGEKKKKGGLCKYDGLTKKERKQKVKEEKREKRKTKLPKNIKKILTKKQR
ncbi:unnamed protein product [Paramecium primaurelia]|uniref:Serine/threonine-protein kinase RIO1 n=1 Tax=Paramecium primaurelia TaxID=5886 RepID=A0A8S1LZA8_PARPR|nr:unnamed protein product [Paramecium primaurelia]